VNTNNNFNNKIHKVSEFYISLDPLIIVISNKKYPCYNMKITYSLDLRQRIIKFVKSGSTISLASKIFSVHRKTIEN